MNFPGDREVSVLHAAPPLSKGEGNSLSPWLLPRHRLPSAGSDWPSLFTLASGVWGSNQGPDHIPDGPNVHTGWCLAPSLLLRKRHLWSFSQDTFAALCSRLYREPPYSQLNVHGKEEGKLRDHTKTLTLSHSYLLSFTNLSKVPFCGSSAIFIQQWLKNRFKTITLAIFSKCQLIIG